MAVNYIAMTADGKVFDSSFEKGRSYDIRCVYKNLLLSTMVLSHGASRLQRVSESPRNRK